MGEIEWAMWANEQALLGSVILLIGGVIGVAGMFANWQFAAACIPTSIIVILFEYPRSKRKKGTTIERAGQKILVPVVDKLGPLAKNYYVRFIAQLIFSVPACWLLPTIVGGMCLMVSAIIYLVAAIRGEEWKPVVQKKYSEGGGKAVVTSEPPTHPPPRPPVRKDAGAESVAVVHDETRT